MLKFRKYVKHKTSGNLTCPLCGESGYRNLFNHLKMFHHLTKDEIKNNYIKEQLISKELQKLGSSQLINCNKNNWNDPKIRLKIIQNRSIAYKGYKHTQKTKNKISKSLKQRLNKEKQENPEIFYKKYGVWRGTHWDDEKRKEAAKRRMENNWKDPIYRKKIKEKVHISALKLWQDPNYRQQHILKNKRVRLLKVELKNKEIVHVRSSYEKSFILFLDKYNISYEYEKLKIPYKYNNETHTYIPDFYFKDKNLIVEIKPFYEKLDEIVQLKYKASINLNYNYLFITEKELYSNIHKKVIDENKLLKLLGLEVQRPSKD